MVHSLEGRGGSGGCEGAAGTVLVAAFGFDKARLRAEDIVRARPVSTVLEEKEVDDRDGGGGEKALILAFSGASNELEDKSVTGAVEFSTIDNESICNVTESVPSMTELSLVEDTIVSSDETT